MNEEKTSKFKQACIASYTEWCKKLKISEEDIEYSNRHKKKINRIWRDILSNEKIVYPEVDNIFERIRSNIIGWLKIYKK